MPSQKRNTYNKNKSKKNNNKKSNRKKVLRGGTLTADEIKDKKQLLLKYNNITINEKKQLCKLLKKQDEPPSKPPRPVANIQPSITTVDDNLPPPPTT